MNKITNFLNLLLSKRFNNLSLITSTTTLNLNNKFFMKLLIVLIILKIFRTLTKKILTSKKSEHNEVSEIVNNEIVDSEIVYNDIINSEIINNESNIKNNIKLICKKINKNIQSSKDPYSNNKNIIEKKYKNENKLNEFILNVNSNTCSIPIFNMRKYDEIDYYYNFILHDFDSKKINNLIMCKDIHKWMSTSSLSNEDLSDELIPIYYLKKINDNVSVYEYLKIFINTSDDDQTRNALVQKGNDYLTIEKDTNELIEKGLIKDLLNSRKYFNYNLSLRDGICTFLDKLLSLVLISPDYIGDNIHLSIDNYVENIQTYEHHLNTVNSDLCGFNTTI
jgi:hypothetical protein